MYNVSNMCYDLWFDLFLLSPFFCVYVKCVWSIFDNITIVCTSNACYDPNPNVYVDVSGRLILKRMMDPSKKVIKTTMVVIVSMMIIHTSLLWTVNYNTLFVFILYHIYSVHKLYLQHTHTLSHYIYYSALDQQENEDHVTDATVAASAEHEDTSTEVIIT